MHAPEENKDRGAFPHTRWTIVAAAQGATDQRQRKRALSELCEAYWYPLYAFLRRQGETALDAEDLTQGFFAHLLSGERLQLIQAEKGRLRSYLLSAIKNYVTTQHRRAQTQKRGGGESPISIDAAAAEERYSLEPATLANPEKLYEAGWALTLLGRAMDRLRAEYEAGDRLDVFEALQGSIARESRDADKTEEIAQTLGLTPNAVGVALHRLRKRYRLALEAEIADTVTSPDEIEEEIDHLHRVFSS